jgi:hypothetical protein
VVKVQTYRQIDTQVVPQVIDKLSLYAALGMYSLIDAARPEPVVGKLKDRVFLARTVYGPELCHRDMLIWQKYFPFELRNRVLARPVVREATKGYNAQHGYIYDLDTSTRHRNWPDESHVGVSEGHGKGRPRDWREVRVTNIPTEALEEMNLAQALACFDCLEFRTSTYSPIPKPEHSDPVVMGVIQDGVLLYRWPVARWGDALISLEQMAKKVGVGPKPDYRSEHRKEDLYYKHVVDRIYNGEDGPPAVSLEHCGQPMHFVGSVYHPNPVFLGSFGYGRLCDWCTAPTFICPVCGLEKHDVSCLRDDVWISRPDRVSPGTLLSAGELALPSFQTYLRTYKGEAAKEYLKQADLFKKVGYYGDPDLTLSY